MKILYLDWLFFGRIDIQQAFSDLGHTIIKIPFTEEINVLGFHNAYIGQLSELIENEKPDFAFSVNYYPNLSEACQRTDCKYVSIIYDNPNAKIYSINIINPCNYIFTFDYHMYQSLRDQFVTTIHYMPLAVNAPRMAAMTLTPSEQTLYSHDVSFVGQLYNEDHNYYDWIKEELTKKNDTYTLGHIDGLIEAQLKLYGQNFLSSCVTKSMLTTVPDSVPDSTKDYSHFTTAENAYADHVLCRRLAEIERLRLLTSLSQSFETGLFTRNPNAQVGNASNYGYVDYYNHMPKIFKSSKINLNITLRSIQSGIPLRAMDIMGAGGFLLTNYQEDFLRHFEPNIDYVYFESEEDMLAKVEYYLSHETERKAIAANGYRKILSDHTHTTRLSQIIEMITQ